MLGTCSGNLSRGITFASTPYVVNKELEPYFTMPTVSELFTFGEGGQCMGTFVVTLAASPAAFTGLDTMTRLVEFEDVSTLPATVTLTVDAQWTYAQGSVSDLITLTFETESIFYGDYIELDLNMHTESPIVAVSRGGAASSRSV